MLYRAHVIHKYFQCYFSYVKKHCTNEQKYIFYDPKQIPTTIHLKKAHELKTVLILLKTPSLQQLMFDFTLFYYLSLTRIYIVFCIQHIHCPRKQNHATCSCMEKHTYFHTVQPLSAFSFQPRYMYTTHFKHGSRIPMKLSV